MAHALTFRNMAKNFQRQSDAYGRLAKIQDQASKDIPQNNAATEEQLKAAIAMADLATRSFFIAEGLNAQAEQYNQLATDAGEPP
jgi:hypothetical protein